MKKMTKIDEVTWFPVRPTERGLIGFSSCRFDKKLSLNSISVYTKPNGDIRLLFPNKVLRNGKEISIFYPIDTQTYEEIRTAILKKITAFLENVKGKSGYGKDNKTDNRAE